VLYHQLDLDRSRGTYDRKRFQKYIEIPRNVSYAEPKFLERCRKDQSLQEGIVSLGQDFTGVTLLPTVTQDEPLVVDYLAQFFGDAKDTALILHVLRSDVRRGQDPAGRARATW